jgi:hypothetical protein
VGFRAASACAMGRAFNARPFSHEHSPRSYSPNVYTGGVSTDFAVPGATGTYPQGINNAGHIVGTYDGSNSFLYSNGIFMSVTDPLGVKGTLAEGIMFEVIYLFIDGLAERLHLGQPREAVLTAWGVLADRHKDETGNAFCGCSCGCGC